jgi:PAS domain S-box-containing protein
MILWWGPELTVLYNDPYIPILGAKHPERALGMPGREVWQEVWPVIEPLLRKVMTAGEANWADDLQLFINRKGYPEECYFQFSYSPISDESGGIGGVFTPVSETTQKVVAERRLRTLREMAQLGNRATSAVEACRRMFEAIENNPYDIPLAALYLASPSGEMELAAGTELSPQADPNTLPPGPWGEPPSALVAKREGAILLVAGVNARKRLDADYESFFELVAQQISGTVASARMYESLAELDRQKTQFFSNISHEFRTPLTLMLGPLEEVLTLAEGLPEAASDQIAVAHRNALRLQKMVNTLLEFSRIEAGRIQASYEPTELGELTAGLASTFRSAMERVGLQFTVQCSSLSEPVWIDRDMWEKVVLNLLSNAFKYTFEGGVTVRLRERSGFADLLVQDTGTGISAAEVPRLFERFHRVTNARGRTQEGSGIGLALVAELVRLHGGTVAAESTVGVGSTFTVSIPMGHGHLPQDRLAPPRLSVPLPPLNIDSCVTESEDKISLASGSEGRVLLVDDNADMREYLSRILATHWQVETATNGKQALALALADPPDLLLTDVMMPELDGFGLLKELRANSRTSRLPVIMLSARAGEESRSEGMEAGADDYLVKPFSARELTARVGAHVTLSRVRKEAETREAQLRAEAEAARDKALGILESITDGFFTLDKNWCFTYINPTGEKLMGMTRDELMGKNHWDLFPAAIGTIGDREYHRAVAEKVQTDFEIFYPPWDRWYAVRAYPTEQGGMSSYFRDITENKKAEQAQLESEQRFRQLADNISQFAWMADARGNVFWYNQRWYDYTGLSPAEMAGFDWRKLNHPDHLDRALQSFQRSIETGDTWQETFPLRGKTGEWRWFLSRASPIRDSDGNIFRWFGTNTDITDQLETEENLRRANRDLEQFAFSASHDLQEPLRNVSIYSQLLQKHCGSSLDAQSTQFLGYLLEGTDRMALLISDLLAYTRAAVSEDEPIQPVQSERVFETVLTGLDRAVLESSAVITRDPLPVIAVQEVHLQQLFQNLVSNALKYRKDNEPPRIHVSAERKDTFWQFSVRDNGIGISPIFHAKVFGLFKRLHPKGSKYAGTGIGLAICQKVVERYGGRIWVESLEGGGATFFFTLPAIHEP